jgi:hypothetical protein
MLNLNDTFIVKPLMQRTVDWICYEAFTGWIGKLQGLRSVFLNATTDLELLAAYDNSTSALELSGILGVSTELDRSQNFSDHIYLHMQQASYLVRDFIEGMASGNNGTARPLSTGNLQKISEVASVIGDIIEKVGTLKYAVDPIQQLKEKGVLVQVNEDCTQIIGIIT